jgi:hypothetical protein
VFGALATVTALAWAYLLLGGGIETEMMDMGGGQTMAMLPAWSPTYAVLISVMWWVMMEAMMLPTAAPTVLLVTCLAWDRIANPNLVPATALLFASGYLLVWCGFSLAATLLQWSLDNAGLLSERMAFADAILASTVLIAAGVYQWTPLKDACLRQVRLGWKAIIQSKVEAGCKSVTLGPPDDVRRRCHARRAFKASATNLVDKQLWARRAVWVTHIPSPVERVRAAIREKRALRSFGRQGYTTITYDDHDPLGLDEEAAHRFRAKRR